MALDFEPESFPHLYELGKEAYLDEDWGYCVKYMESAINEYRVYHQEWTQCRLRCDCDKGFEPLMKQDVDDLHFYDKQIRKTLCLIKECKGGLSQNQIASDILSEFDTKLPYNYLQLCYLKVRCFVIMVSSY